MSLPKPSFPRVEFLLSVGTWDIGGTAYPDTAFEGGITIPEWLTAEILAPPDWNDIRLADDTIRRAPHWDGVVELEGRSFRVQVIALGKDHLLGREVLDQLEICFVFGREVRLKFREV